LGSINYARVEDDAEEEMNPAQGVFQSKNPTVKCRPLFNIVYQTFYR